MKRSWASALALTATYLGIFFVIFLMTPESKEESKKHRYVIRQSGN